MSIDDLCFTKYYSHKKKGGIYQIESMIHPAGNAARAVGKIVVYRNVSNVFLPKFYRPIEDFVEAMEEYEEKGEI